MLSKKENEMALKQLLSSFVQQENSAQNTEIKKLDTAIKVVPKIYYNDFLKNMKVEFKIGNKQLYKIKDLSDFYEKMLQKTIFQYGAKLEFKHEKESFEIDSLPMLDFLLKYAEIVKYTNEATENMRYYGKTLMAEYITVSNTGLDDLFEALKNKTVLVQKGALEKNIYFADEAPNIKFQIKQKEDMYNITCNVDIFGYELLQGKEYIYFWIKDTIYRCQKQNVESLLTILDVFKKNYINQIELTSQQLENFFSFVAPKIQENIDVSELPEETKKKCIPEKLGVKIYLDYDKNNYITADILFCYGEVEFNPLKEPTIFCARNLLEENITLAQFMKTGFMFDKANSRLILAQEEKIYDFLAEEIEDYMRKYEVLATDKFKNKEIKPFSAKSVGVKITNHLVEIDLANIGMSLSEITEMIEKYHQKKKFHRLKDGTYIQLEKNETLDFIDEITDKLGKKTLEDSKIYLPMYRAFYLERMLNQLRNVEILKNKEYVNLIQSIENNAFEEEIEVPKNLNAELRTYQKIGYQWLKTLDYYQFGGVLADDMGLGKTLQILAVILSYINEQKENAKTSIVVCPSSLTLNWLNEVHKFTPTIKATVISGSASEREKKISELNNYQLIITSYDSLKRDIVSYEDKNYHFKYVIADEAQYMKNNHTQNAKAIKLLQAETRYALTGTPIENSLSELWSIFDYIMPNYLFSHKKFKEEYETAIVRDNDQEILRKLKKMLEPFILRRNKKEVLTELPDKTITVLYNEMNEEQEKVYLSFLARAKKEVIQEIEANGFESSQIKILALLMRLRQICCHPGLFLQDYENESSKLVQCLELVEDAITAGHKILIFSGYTSMLEKMEKELKQRKVSYFKLTGQTKVSDRVELVDKFNEDETVKVFLISLKAGGTGLNLTGADMVIHYDPWWNLSAENQATDRTYRIGQKNNVQVYKLITQNTIEEKIYELQQKKAKLADNLLSTQETFINRLSKEDIMQLFG